MRFLFLGGDQNSLLSRKISDDFSYVWRHGVSNFLTSSEVGWRRNDRLFEFWGPIELGNHRKWEMMRGIAKEDMKNKKKIKHLIRTSNLNYIMYPFVNHKKIIHSHFRLIFRNNYWKTLGWWSIWFLVFIHSFNLFLGAFAFAWAPLSWPCIYTYEKSSEMFLLGRLFSHFPRNKSQITI